MTRLPNKAPTEKTIKYDSIAIISFAKMAVEMPPMIIPDSGDLRASFIPVSSGPPDDAVLATHME
jgi:hypothetical protein